MSLAAQSLGDEPESAAASPLRPSEYTAALIQALRARAGWARGANVLEIGSGSGVVLAALGRLGAASLCGVDIENMAVASGAALLHGLGFGGITEMHHGDMWSPVSGRRFDLVAANLPQFPMPPVEVVGRLPSWSSGGAEGRHVLDSFLGDLAAHLAPGGRAVITHNAFIELDKTRERLASSGLALRVAMTMLVHVPAEKLRLMTPSIVERHDGRSIWRYGRYAFAEIHIVEIGAPAALA